MFNNAAKLMLVRIGQLMPLQLLKTEKSYLIKKYTHPIFCISASDRFGMFECVVGFFVGAIIYKFHKFYFVNEF